MCTMLTMKTQIECCGKSVQAPGWIALRQVNVGYDCPFHLDTEHALNLDFVNEAQGPSARVAVELTPESARQLAMTILAMLDQAETDGYLEDSPAFAHSQ